MNPSRFDAIARFFASRQLSHRKVVGGFAAAAQHTTPALDESEAPSGRFLDSLEFPHDNRPYAAPPTDHGKRKTTVAAVELLASVHGAETARVTYEMEALDHREEPDPGFAATPVDLTNVGRVFRLSHRFTIDCCPPRTSVAFPRQAG